MKNPSCAPDYDYLCIAVSAITGHLFLIIIIGIPLLLFFAFKNSFPNLFSEIFGLFKSIFGFIAGVGAILLFLYFYYEIF